MTICEDCTFLLFRSSIVQTENSMLLGISNVVTPLAIISTLASIVLGTTSLAHDGYLINECSTPKLIDFIVIYCFTVQSSLCVVDVCQVEDDRSHFDSFRLLTYYG